MPPLRDAQIVELFHLAFLQVLQARVDPVRYVLKGGANLRYFFGSLRYSEDIDLDARQLPHWALAKKVDGILDSPTLAAVLRPSGLSVKTYTKPKQTATTQRWKLAIAAPGRNQPMRTKIEFSHRKDNESKRGNVLLEPVPGRIVSPYALRAPTLQHYTATAAIEQKVRALAGRSQTQARDVFDLELLLRLVPLGTTAIDAKILTTAAERGIELPFDAFRDQVAPFLDPEAAELYDNPDSWQRTRLFVAEALLAPT